MNKRKSAKGHDVQTESGITNTVATCGSGMLIGSILGFGIKLFLN